MLTRARIDTILRNLLHDGALPIHSEKFGGYPVRDSFIGYVSPTLKDHIEDMASFISRGNYPDPHYPELPKNEIGQISNLRIVLKERMDPNKVEIDYITRSTFDIDE